MHLFCLMYSDEFCNKLCITPYKGSVYVFMCTWSRLGNVKDNSNLTTQPKTTYVMNSCGLKNII